MPKETDPARRHSGAGRDPIDKHEKMRQMKPEILVLCAFLCAGPATAFSGDSAALAGEKSGPVSTISAAAAGRAAVGPAALKILEERAGDSTLPDSARMAAAGKRADAAFSLREYETARDWYKKAAGFEKPNGRYLFRYAQSALANGDTAAAKAALTCIAEKGLPGPAQDARCVLGEIALDRSDPREALEQFQKAGHYSPKNSWSVPAELGKLVAARALGMADSAAVYERHLSEYDKTMLERERFWLVRTPPPAMPWDSASARPAARPAGRIAGGARDSSYTLQIGAFGTRERANALRKRLARAFRDVACVPTVIDERTFYRILVGKFPSRDEAEGFARKKLTPRGYVYRVVVKE